MRSEIAGIFGAFFFFTANVASADWPHIDPLVVGEVDLRMHQAAFVEGEDGFALSRAQIGARATVGDWFTGVALAEWAKDAPSILDTFISVRPLKWLEVSAGLMKTPLFTSGHDEFVWQLPIPELPMVTKALWPGRDLGAEIHSIATRVLPIDTWLRIGNGSGSPQGNDNSTFALDARIDVALGRAQMGADPRSLLGFRFGAGLHLDSVEDRPGITGTTFDDFAYYRPVNVNGPRYVAEAHTVLLAGPVKITAEASQAKENRSKDTDGNPDTPRVPQDAVYSRGGYAEIAWMVTGQHRSIGQWPIHAPISRFDGGGVEVSARVERLDLDRGARDVTPGGATSAAYAVRWWATSFCALSAAAYWISYDAPPVDDPLRIRAWSGLMRATFVTY